ncbi:unnamed protein product [Trichobilharzia regenti]|nr:unnamed protein product [Trichobilharzia regenti]
MLFVVVVDFTGFFIDQACRRCFERSSSSSWIISSPASTTDFSPSLAFHKDCTMRIILAFYICAVLFILSSLLFMPLRWLAKHDRYREVYWGQPSSVLIVGSDSCHPDDGDELFSFCSYGSGQPDEVYDPQETQTTHILVRDLYLY